MRPSSLTVCVCVYVCRSTTSHISETYEAIAIKFDTVTASVTGMHHVFIIILTFIQGDNDLNHKNNKCSIISETIQAMHIKFAVKIVRLKVYINFSQSDDFDLHSGSQLRLILDKILTSTMYIGIIVISRTDNIEAMAFKLCITDLCIAYIYAHAHFDDLDLDAVIKLATTVASYYKAHPRH